jgi:hypothetical protein
MRTKQVVAINEVPSDLLDNYNKKIEEGKILWKDKKVVICGLARNCESKIDKNIDLINKLGKYFKDYKIVIFENNSDDNTREKISSYSNIDLIGNNDGEDFSSGYEESRIQRLANYRSQVQSYIKNNYSDYDHVIIIDFDIKLFSIDGILTSLAWDKNFDVMGSVSLVYQPDLVSEDGFVHYDRWAFKFHTWYEEWSISQEMDMRWFWYWKPPIGAKPIECLSVFGGLAIYKINAYLSGYYDYKHPEEISGCVTSEHNQFHYTLHKNGYNKIYINPCQRVII